LLSRSTNFPLFPYTTLFRSRMTEIFLPQQRPHPDIERAVLDRQLINVIFIRRVVVDCPARRGQHQIPGFPFVALTFNDAVAAAGDRKSTRLNSSHVSISYAV